MNAERLREAATLMRERAEGATAGPWKPYRTSNWSHDNYVTTPNLDGVAMQYALVWKGTDAEHIAAWHPTVALAVADMLDAAASTLNGGRPCSSAALAVADAYLGGNR